MPENLKNSTKLTQLEFSEGWRGGGPWKKSLPWGRYVHVWIFSGIIRGTFLFVNVSFLFFKPPEIQFFGASMLHFKISKNW